MADRTKAALAVVRQFMVLTHVVSKYRPAWKKGIWLDKDDSDMDVIALEGENCAKDFSTMECKHDLGDGSWS